MKKILAMTSVVYLAMASCEKAPQYPNTVTINSSGYQFTESSSPLSEPVSTTSTPAEGITVALYKGIPGADSDYALSVVVSTGSAYALNFQNAYAIAPGAGLYTLRPQDSATNSYTEFGAGGGTSYEISGGTVKVTSASSTNVSGTFTLNVFNSTGSNTITGTITAHKPTISY